jgi:hypothetical protein
MPSARKIAANRINAKKAPARVPKRAGRHRAAMRYVMAWRSISGPILRITTISSS